MGLSFLFPKRSSEEEKKLQQFVNLKVLLSKMPPGSSVVQWRNWTHPRRSCPFLILSPKGSLKASVLSPAPSPLLCGSSLSSSPQFPREISSSPSKAERNPCPGLEGLLESSSAVTQLTLPRQVCGQSVGAFPIE